MKTASSFSNKLYDQIDGVSIGYLVSQIANIILPEN